MLPLSVITWRLGTTKSDLMEPLFLNKDEISHVLAELSIDYSGLFYLTTCQRIILTTNTSDELLVNMLYIKFQRLLGINSKYISKPEFFYGVDALYHLGTVISSLDSVVIGEAQIQNQFKQAFQSQQQFMDQSLKKILTHIIRIGKRVRARSLLKSDRISTISIVQEVLQSIDRLQNAKSIGIIGTGEMGQNILKFLTSNFNNIHIYSRKKSRVGKEIFGTIISDFNRIKCHDIIILATNALTPIFSLNNIESILDEKITIVDLGMPRNCNPNVAELSNVTLIGMEDLVVYSKNNLHNKTIESAFAVLDHEINQIIQNYRKETKNTVIMSLREDLINTANSRRIEFITDDPKYDKKFDQFINQLIHVSQQHLENILLENLK